tara:strand:+ start:51 stop:767 length:717 start_codon:yes stop_codon:yes gene_type:complete
LDTLVVFIENENGHLNLTKSLDMLDIDYHRLFEGGEWTTYFNKLQIYVDGLKEIENEWVLLTDSRDVLFYRDMNEINSVYKKYYSDYDIVVQAETFPEGCVFFRETDLKRYKFNDTEYCYPCSGLLMGRRLEIIKWFENVIKLTPKPWNIADQPALEWCMSNLNGYKITLDEKCRLFQQTAGNIIENDKSINTSGVNFHLHYNKNFIKNTYTNTEPCIFHSAGNAFLHQVWKIIHGRM